MLLDRAESNNTDHTPTILLSKTSIGKIWIACDEYEMVSHLHDQ